MSINGGTIVSYLELDMSKYSTALKMAKTQAGVLGNGSATAAQKLVGLGNAAQIVGRRLTRGVTAPIIGLGFAATKSAITQESAFAGVRKTVDATAERYGELQSTLRKMSTDKPTNFSGLSGIMEISGQLGVSERYIEKFTGTMADLEQTTDLTGESAATMMAQYANVSGMSLNNIDRLGSTVVELGNNTATTESKIVGFMQNLSGMAKLLNMSDPDVAGLAATLASLGLDEAAGASSINRTMQTMQQAVLSGGAALNTFAATAGMSAEAFAASFRGNSMQALDQFVTGLGRMRAEGGNVYAVLDDLKLDDIRVTDTLLRLSSAEGQLAANTEMANEAWQKNTALTDEASKRYETTESQLQMAKNSLSNAGARIGEAFTPMLARGANVVADIAEGFAGMSDTAKDATVGLGMTAAAAGPLLKIGGGLVKVLAPMGPAGWIALGVAAAAGGIYLLAKNAAEADRALTKAQLAKRFGEITLSAEEMDSILEANFERNPWTSVLQDRMAAIEDSAKTISGLNKQIDKTLFMASVGVDTAELQNLPSLVDQQVSATQRMLQDERYACTIAVRAVYGDSAEGGELIEDFNTYFSGLDAEAAAAGEAVKKAFIAAIADGDVSAEEARAIEALRQKQAEITQKAMLLETESTKTLLKIDANHMELTPESIAGLAEKSSALLEDELHNEEINCDLLVQGRVNYLLETGASQAAIDDAVTQIREDSAKNKQEITLSNISLNFDLYGQQTLGAFEPEIMQLASSLDEAVSWAYENATKAMSRSGLQKGTAEYAEAFVTEFQYGLQSEISSMEMPEDSVRKQAAVMWEALEPDYEALKASTAGMENIPVEYVQMMNWYEGMRRLTLERDEMFGSLGENIDGVTGTMESAGEGAAQSAAEGADSKTDSFSTAGANAGGGFVSGLLGTIDTAAAAGAAVAGAALGSMRQMLQIHSPSRVTRQDGRYTGQGLALGLIDTTRMAYLAGSEVSAAALRGIEDAAQINSPSKAAAADGKYINAGLAAGLISSMASVVAAARLVEQRRQEASRQAAAQAQADAAAAAERQRQQQLKALKDQGAALIAQDARNHQRRMKAYTTQWNAMMAMAGANAVWYQDTPLEKEQAKVKQRYDTLLEQLEEQHEAQMAKLKKIGDEEQKQAAEEAYRDRIAALKDQQSEELDMLQQQYDAQRDLADRLVTAQQNSLQARLDQMNEQRTQDDLQKQLADLEKQKRQSKSAREKRELQEQIDELNRNEELRQAQLQINDQMDMWDRVREAINAGVIGLGDLTGDTSLPTVANGQGLSAIPDLTSSDLMDILAALSQTVTPVANSKAGNHYAIDLRGAVVRDDNDIRAIVDELEARMRSASR